MNRVLALPRTLLRPVMSPIRKLRGNAAERGYLALRHQEGSGEVPPPDRDRIHTDRRGHPFGL